MEPSGVVFLTGAGMSTSAGIPDFRGPQGVWTLDPSSQRLLDLEAYQTEPHVRIAGWDSWRHHAAWRAQPTLAHHRIGMVAQQGATVLTQNFDGLHQAGGAPEQQVLELHGSLATTGCMQCPARLDTFDVLARLDLEPDPHCHDCGGILKPDVIYFGQMLDPGTLARAATAAEHARVFIAVGTTLGVYPVAALAGTAVRAGATLMIINHEPTDYDTFASAVIRDPIDQAVPELIDHLLG